MKVFICATLMFIVIVDYSSAFQCYNCNSISHTGCTEKNPDTSSLSKISCTENCYKWIVGSGVRRGCTDVDGTRPSAGSYTSYTCNQDLCNTATALSVSCKILMLLCAIPLWMFIRRS